MAKEFDESQKKAIKVDQNAVVSAGAGSGKTSVLSARFAHLINEGLEVDQILTLTFTKKATVEMSGRIYKTLKEKKGDEKAEKAVKNFYKANIKTLDSYCNSVAKLGAHFYGVSPDFTQDADKISSQVSAMALPFILKHRDNLAIKALVSTKDFAQIANELFVNPILEHSTVAEPIDFRRDINRQKNEIVNTWKTLSKKVLSDFNDLEKAYKAFDGDKSKTFYQRLKNIMEHLDLPECAPLSLEFFDNYDAKAAEIFEDFAKCVYDIAFLSQSGSTAKGLENIKSALNALRESIKNLIPVVNFITGFGIVQAIVPLLEEFQTQVNSLKRNSGILTFADIASIALCTLKEHPEIRQIEKERYKAIMIDEFQDNNSMQRDLLFMLAEKPERNERGIPSVGELCPNKLFFVGDEKQSIYRFRGADVSVFRNLSDDFKDGNLELKTNYRSHHSLISAFNTIFGGFEYPPVSQESKTLPSVFFTEKKSVENVPKYEAIYHKVDLPLSKQNEKEFPKRIHIARYDDSIEPDEDFYQGEEAEAKWVAKKIKSLLGTEIDGKKIKPSDIAILFRTLNLQPLYERTLLEEGIPYDCEKLTGFFNDGPVNDLISFMRILVYKNDSIAYSQVLRSPFVNLSADELNGILATNLSPFEADAQNILCEESAKRFYHAKELYLALEKSAKIEPLTITLTKLWYETGYRYETLWNRKVEMYNTLYDRLFEIARQCELDTTGLSGFVDGLSSYQKESEKLEGVNIPLEKGDSVHIMTIFASKGLEFPIVFVCGTHKGTQKDRNLEPVFYNQQYGFSINTPGGRHFPEKSNYFYEKSKKLNESMACAELRRITYVALTRAESEIYITGIEKPVKEPEKFMPENGKATDKILEILLPTLNFYQNADEQGQSECSPFIFEKIEPISKFEEEEKSEFRENTYEEKLEVISTLHEIFADSKLNVIQTENPESIYISPSHLYEEKENKLIFGQNSVTSKPDKIPFFEINEIVESTKRNGGNGEPRFGYDDFGTIAHAYMEAAVTGEEAKIPSRCWDGLDANEKKIQRVKEVCQDMKESFEKSELGKAAKNAGWKKAEFNFRSRILDESGEEKIVRGTMDLIFKNEDGSYTIVDYKTSHAINEEVYKDQLACYREAISKMLNVAPQKINCVLYYLRYAKEVKIDF